MIGNQNSIETLRNYIDKFFKTNENQFQFIILVWPENIGKTTIATEILKEYLWDYANSDLLHIRDMSEILWKKHVLKVELPKTADKQNIKMPDWTSYQDLWIREVNRRLSQSAMWNKKVLLMENIERMNDNSANAFLKTCEEPLPNRLLIATTSHQSQLLETIISRALLIKFQALSYLQLLDFSNQNNLFWQDQNLTKFACSIAMGRPGILLRLDKTFKENEELKDNYLNLIKLLSEWKKTVETFSILKKLNQNWTFESFLDGRISYTTDNGLVEKWKKRLKVKKLLNTNVSIENLILYWLL